MPSGGGPRNTIPISDPIDGRNNVALEPRPFDQLPDEIRNALERRKKKENDRPLMDLIESKYVMSMILYLDRMSPVLKSDLYHDIARGSGMLNKIDELRELGILEIYCTARTNTNVIVITGKGRMVARRIRDLIESIGAG
ncbi:MAG: hypothetical protein E7Z65_07760 [Thermoplasmata archaeon]|nr:hypothetical protein [Thermoplasmata archaeon]